MGTNRIRKIKHITNKLRFKVFKRDSFKCVYCGEGPPSYKIEIDHVVPKSKGGTDDLKNLATSCYRCNRGKSDLKLDEIEFQKKESLILTHLYLPVDLRHKMRIASKKDGVSQAEIVRRALREFFEERNQDKEEKEAV